MKQTRREFLKTIFSVIGLSPLGNLIVSSQTKSDDGEWHHVLEVYDEDNIRGIWLNVDGVWFDPEGNRISEPPDLRKTWYGDELTHCNRCGEFFPVDDAEVCWWCQGELCIDCWERIGHCGHDEAHMENYKAAHIQQPGESILTACNVIWSEDELGQFWVGEQYVNGKRVGSVGNYYDDIDEETGLRYSKDDQILMSPQYLCIHGQGEDCQQCRMEQAAQDSERAT